MGTEPKMLHVAFFPLMAAGHMIPTLDMAKLLACRNVKTTIITTPLNAPTFTKPLENYYNVGPPIDVEIIPFSTKEVGLPDGVENLDQFTSDEETIKFIKAINLLQESLEKILEKSKPNCLVADVFLPFATDVAAKFNIPRLVFHGTSILAQCATHSIFTYEPHKYVLSNDEEFFVPHIPREIKITLAQLPEFMRGLEDCEIQEEWMKIFMGNQIAEAKSFGVIMNSFDELEPDCADHYRKVIGRRAWNLGPVSLCNRENEAKTLRGRDSSIDQHECLKWLDSKKPKSVVYICFGSLVEVSTSQLHEIAKGLEASEQDFIWVVKKCNEKDEEESLLPRDFEKRVECKGLIIKGWAPQMLILGHEAIGAFVTHCGWNSILESISCGIPMVTWPAFAEQFFNEKLVTDIVKIGIAVGAKQWHRKVDSTLTCEDIKKAITRVMVGEEALEIRSRSNNIKDLARKAIEFGGSSYCNMDSLIQELSSYNAGNH